MEGEIKVSDLDTSGKKGIYDSRSFCDSVIIDVDDALKQLFSGSRVAFCNTMIQIVRKMGLLKEGILNDLKSKDEAIANLKNHIQDLQRIYCEREPQSMMKGETADGCADVAQKESDV